MTDYQPPAMAGFLPRCYFCGDSVDPRGIHRHHLNHKHDDNRPENVVDVHPACHTAHHAMIRALRPEQLTDLLAFLDSLPDGVASKHMDRLPDEVVGALISRAMEHISWD